MSYATSTFLEAPANDLYGLLQLALIPSDTFAYAVYLRSPFVNLGDDAVLSLLTADEVPFSAEAADLDLPEAELMKYVKENLEDYLRQIKT